MGVWGFRVSKDLCRQTICRVVQVGDVLHEVALLDLHAVALQPAHILPL